MLFKKGTWSTVFHDKEVSFASTIRRVLIQRAGEILLQVVAGYYTRENISFENMKNAIIQVLI
jgi:hypothetical protein